MRVIEMPPVEVEKEIRCKCGALLGYVESECLWENGATGDIKYIKCILCGNKIRVGYIPYPNPPKGMEFWY